MTAMKIQGRIAALVVAALAGGLIGFWIPRPDKGAATPATIAPARAQLPPVAEPAPAPVAAPEPLPPEMEPVAAAPVAAPAALPPPDYARAEQEIARIQAQQAEALEREGDRIEERLARTTDPNELAILNKLEDALTALETVQEKMAHTASDAERLALTPEILPLIGTVMQLNQADRQYRLTELARSLGLAEGADVNRLLQETETIYRETQRDLSPFLSQGGPFQPAAPEPFRTTPPPSPYPHP